MKYLWLIAVGYIAGSFLSAYAVARRHGKNITKHGSGNPGFANTWRVIGPLPALLVLFLDAAKGLLPILLALHLHAPRAIVLATGAATILGHVFPLWHGGKGGKGIATGLGVLLALDWRLGVLGLGCYAVVWLGKRSSATASLVASWCTALASIFIRPDLSWFIALFACFALWTHRQNIRERRNGKR